MRDSHLLSNEHDDNQRGLGDQAFVLIAGVVGIIGVIALLAWFLSQAWSSAGSVPPQNAVPVAQLSQPSVELARQFRPYSGVIPVLSYSGVSDDGAGPLLTPTEFQLQMSMLDVAGFTTVNVEQVRALAMGEVIELPVNPIFITFDGATSGLWTDVDPILADHGFSAEVFLTTEDVTAQSDTAELNKETLQEMKATNRWGFGAHVLATTLERPQGESLIVWESRIRSALALARDNVASAVGVKVVSMSYPYSDGGLPQEDKATAARLPELVGEQFDLGFLDISSSTVISPTIDKTMAPRLPQTRTTLSPEALLGAIEDIIPRGPVGAVNSLSWSMVGDGSCLYADHTLVISANSTTTCLLESSVQNSWEDVALSGILQGVTLTTTASVQLRISALSRIEISFLPDAVLVQRQADGIWMPVAREPLSPAEGIGPQAVLIELRGSLLTVTLGGRQIVIAEVGPSSGTGRVSVAAVTDEAGVVTLTEVSVAAPTGL